MAAFQRSLPVHCKPGAIAVVVMVVVVMRSGAIEPVLRVHNKTRGHSNLTKSASRGAHSPVRGHPRGSKVVPLNSWGRVSY